ncbi:OM (translocase of outer membrane) complex subunit [Komagataella phaffii CBS 7435]|uniref:OM (Translocase of outer membrane) complex subunit n=1 Tax=Komagataella phaffii (strain ATCC 76273 / CBS 7435 / CECT 11047 / NRRL Y-11430 / Wegner 21-1) TaxID=981350 RepID=A0A1G4KQG1_KOMPC|nr:Probable component of the TOM complex [Komagataella phaffii CBS 7435]SCV12248.1 OM (translocase of outer membrane) complex subunit [Komagataella phaffii CBS 7435]
MSGLALSEESKERIVKILDTTTTVVHYGWIPFVLYVGWISTPNRPSLINLLSPLPSA